MYGNILINISVQNFIHLLQVDASHSVLYHLTWYFSGTEQAYKQTDKLLPIIKHGILRSEAQQSTGSLLIQTYICNGIATTPYHQSIV